MSRTSPIHSSLTSRGEPADRALRENLPQLGLLELGLGTQRERREERRLKPALKLSGLPMSKPIESLDDPRPPVWFRQALHQSARHPRVRPPAGQSLLVRASGASVIVTSPPASGSRRPSGFSVAFGSVAS